MAIEIRQLVIRAVVEAGPRPEAAARQPPPPPADQADRSNEALLAACVREVLRELRRSRER